MVKKKSMKADFVVPGDYYRNLERKEKGMFLNYLSFHYGMNVNTTRNKLLGSNGQEFNTLEKMVVYDVINNELWKESNSTVAPMDTCISRQIDVNKKD